MNYLIAAAFFIAGCAGLAILWHIKRRDYMPTHEPMEFNEPPVRTRIWSDAINHERETP